MILKLRYVNDEMPGIRRVRRGKGFAYQAADGHWLKTTDDADKAHLARIRSLAIPPAYEAVWICPVPEGHVQATARDARGRKQYRYHPLWRERREADKFDRMHAFGLALPRLRRRIAQTLSTLKSGVSPSREVVLATLVRLLDTTLVRVGNEEYARTNRSYGLTTLRNRHAEVHGSRLVLRFRGKSGVQHEVFLNDARVAAVVRRCQDLPGQDLFQYTDDDGIIHMVGSADVNDYIRDLCGDGFSAKDFRTWHATVHAWSRLAPGRVSLGEAVSGSPPSPAWRKRLVNEALTEVAARLGNTVAVCRKSYVHPDVLVCALADEWPSSDETLALPGRGLTLEEKQLLAFLESRSLTA